MSASTLEDLIARTALGDSDAFSSLYDATSAKLMAVALRVLSDRAMAEDVLQDAFIKVWRNADRYAVTGHSPMTWLITITRNTAIDRLRTRRSMADVGDMADTLPDHAPTPEQQAVAAGESNRIAACLDELDPDRRQAVRGAYLEGQTYADLAKIHDVPLNTIRTWLRRSLIRLRDCLNR